MNIMIDYDRTYTSAIAMWREVIDNSFLHYGHKVFLVTSRGTNMPIDLAQDFISRNIPIIYCNFLAKRPHCESLGISIDIWIDDDPQWITDDIILDPARPAFNNYGTDYLTLSLTGGKDDDYDGYVFQDRC